MASGLTGAPAPPSLSPPVGEALPPGHTNTHTPPPPPLIICQGKERLPSRTPPSPLLPRSGQHHAPGCDWYGLVGFSVFLHLTCHCHSPTWMEHLLPNRGSNQRSDGLHKETSPLFSHYAGTRR